MNRNSLFFALLLAAAPAAGSSADPNAGMPYLFVGVFAPAGKAGKCSDYQLTEAGFATHAEAKAAEKAFKARKDIRSFSSAVFMPGRSGIIYRYRRKSLEHDCEMNAFRVQTAGSVESAEATMRSDARIFRSNFVSEPEVIRRWGEHSGKKKTQHMVGNTAMSVVTQRMADGRNHIFVQMKNRDSKQAARIEFTVNGAVAGEPLVLEPGATANVNLGKFTDAIQDFRASTVPIPAAPERSRSVIDYVKDAIRNKSEVRLDKEDSHGRGNKVGGARG